MIIKAVEYFSDDLQEHLETEGWYDLPKNKQTDKKFQEIINKYNK